MDSLALLFRHKKINRSQLEAFGFQLQNGRYVYHTRLQDSGFLLTVTVTKQGAVSTHLLDPDSQEPYTLHLASQASGCFVGKIKQQYTAILTDIANRCFDTCIFHIPQTTELISYIQNTYQDELEFLWPKSPRNAIWRRKSSGKWYGVLLTVSKQKLGIESEEIAEVLNLHLPPEQLTKQLNQKGFYPGYHMNKKHWCSIILDDTVPTSAICELLHISYELAV